MESLTRTFERPAAVFFKDSVESWRVATREKTGEMDALLGSA